MTLSLTACDHEERGVSAESISSYLIGKRFGEHRLRFRTPSSSKADIKFKRFGVLSISEHTFGCSVQMYTPMMTKLYHLQVTLSGESKVRCHNKVQMLKAGDAVIVTPNTSLISDYSADCRKLIVGIPAEFLMQTAREFGYHTNQDLIYFRFKKQPLPTTGSFISLLDDILQQPQGLLCERGLMYYSKLLCNAIFSTFECHLSQSQSAQLSQHRDIERVRDYVQQHITDDISVEELARLCQISRKSLYNLFERETGLTPSAYVRCLKLESAHLELSGNQSIRNVTEVALKYGFTNLGRFSAQYRDYIGELPSQTLRSVMS